MCELQVPNQHAATRTARAQPSGSAYKSKLSFQYGFKVRLDTCVVLVCSPLMVATAKGSGNPGDDSVSTTATAHDPEHETHHHVLNTSRLYRPSAAMTRRGSRLARGSGRARAGSQGGRGGPVYWSREGSAGCCIIGCQRGFPIISTRHKKDRGAGRPKGPVRNGIKTYAESPPSIRLLLMVAGSARSDAARGAVYR